jgi:hypothetical protein
MKHGLKPSLWASVIPRDPTEHKPNQYAEMLRAVCVLGES